MRIYTGVVAFFTAAAIIFRCRGPSPQTTEHWPP